MKSASPATYGTRIEAYQRRERLTIWVAAAIAALIAFVGARALGEAPPNLTKIIFTFAVAAGLLLAFARVGFEWQATILERKMRENNKAGGALLEGEDVNWPLWPELYWAGSIVVIALAWTVMLWGIWKYRPQNTPTHLPDSIELRMLPIGAVGPFADCSVDPPSTYEDQLDLLVKSYRDRVNSNIGAGLIILIGAADNRRLAPSCLSHFGTNEQLAATRANLVLARLEQKLSGEHLQPRYAVLTSGPRHLEANGEADGRWQDRSVNVWVAINPSPTDAHQK
jgi:hypothetical protein